MGVKNRLEIIATESKIQSGYFSKIHQVRKSSDEYNG
jgi:hypothetical protein